MTVQRTTLQIRFKDFAKSDPVSDPTRSYLDQKTCKQTKISIFPRNLRDSEGKQKTNLPEPMFMNFFKTTDANFLLKLRVGIRSTKLIRILTDSDPQHYQQIYEFLTRKLLVGTW